jgi:hypothetical protein
VHARRAHLEPVDVASSICARPTRASLARPGLAKLLDDVATTRTPDALSGCPSEQPTARIHGDASSERRRAERSSATASPRAKAKVFVVDQLLEREGVVQLDDVGSSSRAGLVGEPRSCSGIERSPGRPCGRSDPTTAAPTRASGRRAPSVQAKDGHITTAAAPSVIGRHSSTVTGRRPVKSGVCAAQHLAEGARD